MIIKEIEAMSDEELSQTIDYTMLPDWMKMKVDSDSDLANAVRKEIYKSNLALFNYYMTHSGDMQMVNVTPYSDADQPKIPVMMQMNELGEAARAAHGVTAIEEERMKNK